MRRAAADVEVPREAAREVEPLDPPERDAVALRAAMRTPAALAPFACASSLMSGSLSDRPCAGVDDEALAARR